MTLKRLYQAYVLDLDGTVYLGDTLLPRAGEAVTRLRAAGRRVVFLSNNPTRSRASYAGKLTRLGLATSAIDVLNSSMVMVEFLRARLHGARLFVIGEQPLKDDLDAAGFALVDDAAHTDAVIASFDRTFEYRKLQTAFDAIRRGARFFATNADRYCPVPGGGQPDAAAVIAAIEACTEVKCETVVGKPSRHTINALLTMLGTEPEECLMVGDRLETDIQMGHDARMHTALVLTGATSEAMLEKSRLKPTYVLRNLGELAPAGV